MAMTPYEQARQQASQLEYELSQQLYFERRSRQKRGPAWTSLTGRIAGDHTSGSLVYRIGRARYGYCSQF